MTTRFPTKVDLWLAALMVIAFGFGLGATVMAGIQEGEWFAVPIVIVVFGGVMALTLPTDYTFDADLLIVRSGVIKYRIPLHEIQSAMPSREPWSSPAWSLDRIKIVYGPRKMILISPADREGFFQELRARTRLQPSNGGLA